MNSLPGITEGIESHWQSQVLNPLLQHQLYGVFDQESLIVRESIDLTRNKAEKYYLTMDLLDPRNLKVLLCDIILHIWLV